MWNQDMGETLEMTEHVDLLKEEQEKVMRKAKQKADKMIGNSEGLKVGKEILKLEQGKDRSYMIKVFARIMATTPFRMKKHKCRFEDTTAAASFNEKWLKHYKRDFTYALEKQAGIMIDPGSEFRY